MMKLEDILVRLLGRPLLKTRFPLMNNVLKTFTKSVLIPLALTAAASANRCSYSKESFWLTYAFFGLSIVNIINKFK